MKGATGRPVPLLTTWLLAQEANAREFFEGPMTTIDFYTHCADRFEVASKLVAKAWAQHGTVRVLTDERARDRRIRAVPLAVARDGFPASLPAAEPAGAGNADRRRPCARARGAGRGARQPACAAAAVLFQLRAARGDREPRRSRRRVRPRTLEVLQGARLRDPLVQSRRASVAVASARELLEQADALMRRNRSAWSTPRSRSSRTWSRWSRSLRPPSRPARRPRRPLRGAHDPRRRARAHRGGRGDRDRIDRRAAGGSRRIVGLAPSRPRRADRRGARTGFRRDRHRVPDLAMAQRLSSVAAPLSPSPPRRRRQRRVAARNAVVGASPVAATPAPVLGRHCRAVIAGNRFPPSSSPRPRPTIGRAGRRSPTRFACRCCSGSTSSPRRGCATSSPRSCSRSWIGPAPRWSRPSTRTSAGSCAPTLPRRSNARSRNGADHRARRGGGRRTTAVTIGRSGQGRPISCWKDDDDHRDGKGSDGGCGRRRGSKDPRARAGRARLARHRADADRRDRGRAQARPGDVRVDGRRREIDAYPETVQARRARMAQGEHGRRRRRHPDRRQDRAGDRRPVLGRNRRRRCAPRRGRRGRRRATDARRRVQAAHVAVCVPGQGHRGPEAAQGRGGELQAAGRHRAHGCANARRRSSSTAST